MMKKRTIAASLVAAALALCCVSTSARGEDVSLDGKEYRKISVAEYRDKMKGGWIGQIAGVCWGAPTEFRSCGKIMPKEIFPEWKPSMINDAFGQDDLYVEMTFLRTLEEYGLDVSIRQAGIDFANSEYPLWHANVCGRHNLRCGIAPPNSSHPLLSHCADDIDYQIEADYSGLVSPGMPNNAIYLGEKFGRLMNYGDGLYAGQFIGAAYAEAFFETDVVKIVEKALEAIPAESQYAEMVRDMLAWKKEFPNDWEACWNKIDEKYQRDPNYRRWSCSGLDSAFNIDVKINGAYVLAGLLYGEGDLDKTIEISTRCGQDSDCNPSSAAGILFTTLGFDALPDRFSKELDEESVFDHTAYNFPLLLNVCEKIAVQAVEREGGFVREEDGERYFYIAKTKVVPSALASCAEPIDAVLEGNEGYYTEEELAKIKFREYTDEEAMEKFFNGFAPSRLGPDMSPGMRSEYRGKKNVYMTHPESREVGALMSRKAKIGPNAKLRTSVSYFTDGTHNGDYDLIVRVDNDVLFEGVISKDTVGADGWKDLEFDLSKYEGREVAIEFEDRPNGWAWEAAYFAGIELE